MSAIQLTWKEFIQTSGKSGEKAGCIKVPLTIENEENLPFRCVTSCLNKKKIIEILPNQESPTVLHVMNGVSVYFETKENVSKQFFGRDLKGLEMKVVVNSSGFTVSLCSQRVGAWLSRK